jgi:lysyl-tRNA synthetase class I
VPSGGDRLSDRINKLPKWARDYIHNVHTFVGAEEVQELTLLRDQQKQLLKFIAELKAENRRLKRKLH